MKSIYADVSNITQIDFDKENKIRTCKGLVSYMNYGEAFAATLMSLSAEMCRGEIQYKVSRPLDYPRKYVIDLKCE